MTDSLSKISEKLVVSDHIPATITIGITGIKKSNENCQSPRIFPHKIALDEAP